MAKDGIPVSIVCKMLTYQRSFWSSEIQEFVQRLLKYPVYLLEYGASETNLICLFEEKTLPNTGGKKVEFGA